MKALALALALFVTGCPLLGQMAQLAHGAAWIGDILDAANAGASIYFARNPSLDGERQAAAALYRARTSLSSLSGAIAAHDDEGALKAKYEALVAYADLVQVLDALGVLSARAGGGAETDAPLPAPVELPSIHEIEGALQ
jgi:hypothetical protein